MGIKTHGVSEFLNSIETQGIKVEVKAIVTFAKAYHVAEGGTTNEGITLNYLLCNNLAACKNSKDNSQGYKFSKSSLPLDRAHKLTQVPGYYTLKCDMKVGSNGSPELKPYDLDLEQLCELNLVDLPTEEGSAAVEKPAEPVSTDGKAPEPKNNKKS
ncbi:MAG: hypothetical protein K2I03_12300 [Lachnospiraceae bacterium]|nr:hypothetical protein [Lachnospiraceae bacterium]